MKSRHTWQRLSLGWKVSNELRVNWKASLFTAFVFKRPTDANQFEGIPCPVMWKQQFVFLCCPVSARDCVFPPLREAFGLCERHCCFPVSCFQFAWAIPSFLSIPWLMYASHMLSCRISSLPWTMILLHDSANQNIMFRRD